MADANEDLALLYGQKEREKITKKRRFLSALIDFLLMVGLYLALFYTLGSFCIEKIASAPIERINQEVIRICEENNFPYMQGNQYKLYTLDTAAYIEQVKKEDSSLSQDDAVEKCQKAMSTLSEGLQKSATYTKDYSEFQKDYLFIYTLTIAVVLVPLELMIPIFDKKRRTIGMMITKQALVNAKDNLPASNVKVMIRFFLLFIIENFVFKLIMANYLYPLLALLGTIFVLATRECYTFHDVVSRTKVINQEFIGLEE